MHTHVNGAGAAAIWREAAGAFGVTRVVTQVRLDDCALVRDVLGDMVEFIAFPNFRAPDRGHAMMEGYLADIEVFHRQHGARAAKLWNAPRLRELFPHESGRELVELDGEWRVRTCELAQRLGMMLMVHIADPDTWFRTRYADPARFGRKIDHYRGFERMLDRFEGPWIAAHMGGWPEDLSFLDCLLTRHPNLYLDTSATKWVVRELSLHDPARTREFFEKWSGRLLFGSDVVTTDEHLHPAKPESKHPMADLADSPAAAFDLYSSRYLALRLMFETGYDGESPIADPDLMMLDPSVGPMAAPRLRGIGLSQQQLRTLYRDAAERLFPGRV
ncbi:MAG: amidohydrolase family protein [Phycisphaerales bacterium]